MNLKKKWLLFTLFLTLFFTLIDLKHISALFMKSQHTTKLNSHSIRSFIKIFICHLKLKSNNPMRKINNIFCNNFFFNSLLYYKDQHQRVHSD